MTESFSESSMPYSRTPIASKISKASCRTGPRHTTRHFIPPRSNERTQEDRLSERRGASRGSDTYSNSRCGPDIGDGV